MKSIHNMKSTPSKQAIRLEFVKKMFVDSGISEKAIWSKVSQVSTIGHHLNMIEAELKEIKRIQCTEEEQRKRSMQKYDR